ncbi:flagellar hook protein FlgE [Sphingomonas koreensis]|jgi:flagellar hook protein FlgE|uniref:Flagellar hook protein FlgE n=1 Tax=Sphingomonas koreensis TaxID=93064 RepID=A0A1L6J9N3_9SPHN|nr:flagellar hook protein FlgE [Sphingomonas koreensis]APR52567.1 flagellar biosynthesis protein FlgE [Sphingomonas koreensis]MDC7812901.1 flagellar hook protein FlgE [Sphingomonas koreensis]PJI87888.1 flagellar hook protein FlgE [Sphingomonas koreensis]RSU18230.1 flagellar hook protein FlgE [Sphingomonas koreensis]RSU28610.1 flagellar hook protein FlgE [Sphingomonas koreensis]
MSLYSALYAGVSGLGAQASAMATVADNITNVNTIGYKGVSAQFQTLVTDGRVRSNYSAGGVSATPKALISKQGLLQASSSLTDIGIDGSGFFVVRSGTGDDVSFTRAGSFTPDSQGYLRNSAGYYLQGWPLDADGNYVDNGNLNTLQSIRPNALTGSAMPTSKIALRANLQSTATPITGAYVPGSMASGALSPQFSRSVDVYDAQGTSHRLTFNFVKTAANEWVAEISGNPADIQTVGGAPVATGLLASGKVKFNPDGSLDLAGSDPALFANLDIGWTNGAGSTPIRLSLGSDDGLDGLTQSANESGLLSSSVDGGMLGTVASVEISDAGIVSAIFEDGTSRAIYQLPIATFQNPDGLTRIGGNAYMMSQDSGNFAINKPGALGAGTIAAGKLEASNVDLAQEFSNMILFQRAYSASSKIITTVDDMLQEVSNLKR